MSDALQRISAALAGRYVVERELGRSDLYALGTVLYEMLAGSTPYHGPTAHAILARKMSGPPPSLRVVRPTAAKTGRRLVPNLLLGAGIVAAVALAAWKLLSEPR